MKTLIYWRHSDKKGEVISQEGLDAAQIKAQDTLKKYSISHVFAGALVRTWQTLCAIMGSLGIIAKVHEIVTEIGDNDQFQNWKNAGAKFGSGTSNLNAARQLPKSIFQQVCKNALEGVEKMFATMNELETGLIVGHSPVIEMAALAAGLDLNATQLETNEYIIFEKMSEDPFNDKSGQIIASLLSDESDERP
ncbi:MAG: histidine phosphatase family protein [Patescibacteria group bacterium]